MISKLSRIERFFVGLAAVLSLGLTVGGITMFFTSSTREIAVRAANNNARTQPLAQDRWQQLHEDLSSLLTIVVFLGAGWLMLRVKQDLSGLLALAVGATMVAAVTGLMLRYEAVQVDGLFVERDGFGFIFEADFEATAFGRRTLGAWAFRILFGLHLLFAVGAFAGMIAGLRDIAQDPRVRGRKRQPTRAR